MNKIFDLINDFETIVIFRHMKPDPDALGSQLGLRALLRATFPDKVIYAVGFDEPSLAYLGLMDNAVKFDGAYLAIACDTANTPRMDSFELFEGAAATVKIDHHPNNEPYGDVWWVEPERSSCSEMIADFAFSSNLTMTSEAARLLYGGIIGDTGRFLFPSTSPHTLEVASRLASYDFDRSFLAREMASFELKVARLQGFVYEHLDISKNGAARVTLTLDVMKHFDVTDAETSSIVGTPGNIRSVKSWAIFVEQPDGHFRVRMRSKTIPIESIARRHDGGGHALASGANAYSLDECEAIWQELQNAVE
ncbi:MAG: bifunctional oligoribonuclease/PAP phosphatase NrnA [Streptococcaceae bacterium]|jgi:phosphoesterase RecJ-like protein|nr:bifunctional oligoribonuclease/PAP phosphatase NrnA [Streptococcaceae bacterium]